MKFSNILLVLNTRRPGQVPALRYAVAVARRDCASLTVCEMIDWVVPEDSQNVPDSSEQTANDTIRVNKVDRLNKLIASIDTETLDISAELVVGKPNSEVARLVRTRKYDLVIKPFSGRRILQFFSGAQEDRDIIRSCSCPVWLVNVAAQANNSSILAALDMPNDGGPESCLNQRIINISRSIAIAESRPLHFVHAWRLRGEGHLRAQCNPATDLQIDRLRTQEEATRKIWLKKAVATSQADIGYPLTDRIKPELHVLNGHAKKLIPDLAERLGVGLIVLGTAARTGLSGFAHRNTAETILPRSDCSLLVVRGFENESGTRPKGGRRFSQVNF